MTAAQQTTNFISRTPQWQIGVVSFPPSIGRSKQSNLASFSSKAAALIPSRIVISL